MHIEKPNPATHADHLVSTQLMKMLSGFMGWDLIGLIPDHSDLGVLVDKQGGTTNEVSMVAVYGCIEVTAAISSRTINEKQLIERGDVAVLAFVGPEDTFIRRMKPSIYSRLGLTELTLVGSDLIV